MFTKFTITVADPTTNKNHVVAMHSVRYTRNGHESNDGYAFDWSTATSQHLTPNKQYSNTYDVNKCNPHSANHKLIYHATVYGCVIHARGLDPDEY